MTVFYKYVHDLQENLGIQTTDEDLNSIRSCMKFIIGDDFIDIFVIQSIRYYYQNSNNDNIDINKRKNWIDINEAEKFFGLIILMNFIRKFERDDYLSINPLYSNLR